LNGRVQDVMLSLALLAVILSLSVFLLRQARHTLRYQRELTRLRDELTAANLSLQSLANSDGLTGVANRRYFDRRLHESLQQARVQGWPVSLILIDIDYFKHYNDTYGHVAGDECLKAVASILKNFALRKNDLPARYGGEEFAIILPRYTAEEALKLARAIVEAVYRLNIPHLTSGLPTKRITLSAGCATQRGIAGQQALSHLIERADEALYRAKREGRNRAECEKPDG